MLSSHVGIGGELLVGEANLGEGILFPGSLAHLAHPTLPHNLRAHPKRASMHHPNNYKYYNHSNVHATKTKCKREAEEESLFLSCIVFFTYFFLGKDTTLFSRRWTWQHPCHLPSSFSRE